MAVRPLRHIGLKLVSVGLAALLWIAVAGEEIVERALRIPLEFTNLPAQLEVVGDAPEVVEVRVRGSSGALSRIGSGELVAVLDLRTARAGQRLFHLTGTDVRTPFGVDVVQVSPSSISLQFEPSMTKRVPIVPGVQGDPAPGFVVGTVTAEPPTVEVVGPAGALRSLTEAITDPVTVTGATAPVAETVTVGSPDPSVRLREPQTARVTVSITPSPVEWRVDDIAVIVRNATRRVQVTPRVVSLYLRGPRDAQVGSEDDFEASVDVNGLRPGQYELPVRVVAPARIGVTQVDPPRVKVRVQ